MSLWEASRGYLVGTFVLMGALSACGPICAERVGDALPKAVERLQNSGWNSCRRIYRECRSPSRTTRTVARS